MAAIIPKKYSVKVLTIGARNYLRLCFRKFGQCLVAAITLLSKWSRLVWGLVSEALWVRVGPAADGFLQYQGPAPISTILCEEPAGSGLDAVRQPRPVPSA